MSVELTPAQYKDLRNSDKNHILIDIRQDWEVLKSSIDGHRHIPLTELAHRMDELSTEVTIILYCHHGIRSMNACLFLREHGFTDVLSLKGGIDAWSKEVDQTLPTY